MRMTICMVGLRGFSVLNSNLTLEVNCLVDHGNVLPSGQQEGCVWVDRIKSEISFSFLVLIL